MLIIITDHTCIFIKAKTCPSHMFLGHIILCPTNTITVIRNNILATSSVPMFKTELCTQLHIHSLSHSHTFLIKLCSQILFLLLLSSNK